MEQLGHTTLAMTQRYTHVVPQLMRDAAAAMDRALGS
jgi:integrase